MWSIEHILICIVVENQRLGQYGLSELIKVVGFSAPARAQYFIRAERWFRIVSGYFEESLFPSFAVTVGKRLNVPLFESESVRPGMKLGLLTVARS